MKKLLLMLMVTIGITLNVSEISLSAATTISVDNCNLSGSRRANVKVDIGFDSSYATRDYYAYTNGYGQLTKVTANQIILQNDQKEKVTSAGRYCSDEAKVPGTEQATLDEGHVIADSLGGVSNAYNITPQASSVNRSGGTQYKFEQEILNAERNGKQVTNFVANITYPNTKTQIPSKYSISYKLAGVSKSYSFNNVQKSSNTTTKITDNYHGSNVLTTYYTSGTKTKAVEKTRSGRKVADYSYYSNGKVKQKVTFANTSSNYRTETIRYTTTGKRTEYYSYHSNGKVDRKYLYNSGVKRDTIEYSPTGLREYAWTYHSNGQVKLRSKYNSSGKRTDAKAYNSSGVMTYDYDYRSNGTLYAKRALSSSGKTTKTYYYNPSGKYDSNWEKSTSYSSCAKMESAGITLPVPKGTKMYSANSSRDRDKDGLLCE